MSQKDATTKYLDKRALFYAIGKILRSVEEIDPQTEDQTVELVPDEKSPLFEIGDVKVVIEPDDSGEHDVTPTEAFDTVAELMSVVALLASEMRNSEQMMQECIDYAYLQCGIDIEYFHFHSNTPTKKPHLHIVPPIEEDDGGADE